jgi:hypothetical protein
VSGTTSPVSNSMRVSENPSDCCHLVRSEAPHPPNGKIMESTVVNQPVPSRKKPRCRLLFRSRPRRLLQRPFSPARANVCATMNIYETASADAENAMKNLETLCATAEPRRYANHLEVFLAGSLQVSTLDRDRENLAERGIRTPGRSLGSYKG